eukprot:1310600-Pyramimonas_sp.AAC.1
MQEFIVICCTNFLHLFIHVPHAEHALKTTLYLPLQSTGAARMRDEDARALKATPQISGRGAATESGQGWAEEARTQGYAWDGCPSSLFGLTV